MYRWCFLNEVQNFVSSRMFRFFSFFLNEVRNSIDFLSVFLLSFLNEVENSVDGTVYQTHNDHILAGNSNARSNIYRLITIGYTTSTLIFWWGRSYHGDKHKDLLRRLSCRGPQTCLNAITLNKNYGIVYVLLLSSLSIAWHDQHSVRQLAQVST